MHARGRRFRGRERHMKFEAGGARVLGLGINERQVGQVFRRSNRTAMGILML